MAFAAFDVVKVLLDYGAEIDAYDSHGNNALHCLALRSHLSGHEVENDCVKSFHWIMKNVSTDTVNDMLKTSNKRNFNPLEYAGQLDAWKLFPLMFDSLMIEENHAGVHRTKVYDVTDYESENRRVYSLMFITAFMSVESLRNLSATNFYRSDIIMTWLMKKIKVNLPFMLAWALTRLFLIGVHVYSTMVESSTTTMLNHHEKGNLTTVSNETMFVVPRPTKFQGFLAGYIVIHSVFSILFDVFETIIF